MDTNQTAAPPIADLPDEMSAADNTQETRGNAESAATHVQERDPASIMPSADDRLLSFSAKPRRGRKRILLASIATLALLGIGTAGFLVSPWNHLYPVPELAASARHLAAAAGIPIRAPISPASELANPAQPQHVPPPVRDLAEPLSRRSEIAEIMSFKSGTQKPDQKTDQPSSSLPHSTADTANGHSTEARPPAIIPGELGMPPIVVGQSTEGANTKPLASAEARTKLETASKPAEPAQSASATALPAHQTTTTLNDAVVKSTDSISVAPSSSEKSKAESATVGASAAPMAPGGETPSSSASASPGPGQSSASSTTAKADPVLQVSHLVAAPMTPQDQIKVLNLVTEIAAMVRDLKVAQTELRTDLQKSSSSANAELQDLERRIAMLETGRAVDAAKIAGQPASSSAPEAPSVAATEPVRITRAEAALPNDGSDPSKRIRYHVQAASPGLAMLAQIDRSGGDGAELQVAVGDSIPGYGKVKSIGQIGARWVVTTEHGVIGN